MTYPILIGHLYQNDVSKRIVMPIKDRETYILAKCMTTGETIEIRRYYMFHRYNRLGTQG